ncbi:hypothetical protein MBCUT_17400 [Methanobrevibacter cuticularis]|uniref:Antitoxin SocA-like Panacea domain-containing protein n=1 Tax=Methanobrevibacter cuticularis TaxID=47311 RepID=A0A166D0I8_9EURY|nr:type II toxin-antitoxin system antitoxin SocA domain-containing protein [Methanobrevibacter cuticularis]KZX15073.1 hypothetical protein MBCUT_17400 [Methanobrevibacter cuticularis]
MKLNKEKMKEIVHYIIYNCDNDITRIKLCKILFLSDFNHYKVYNESITNETYKKYPEIPFPYHFINIKDELIFERKIDEITPPIFTGSNIELRYNSLNTPRVDFLKKSELKIVDMIIKKYFNVNNIDLNNSLNDNVVWRNAKNYEILNYNVFNTIKDN